MTAFIAILTHYLFYHVGTALVISNLDMLLNLQSIQNSQFVSLDSSFLHIFKFAVYLLIHIMSIVVVTIIMLKLPVTILKQAGIDSSDEVSESLGEQFNSRVQRYEKL
jgi:hypothetical protein